jgi:predicted nucleotide-binding protein
MIRDEIKFSKFVKRLRAAFQEILVKPLYLQMCIAYKDLAEDPGFKTQVALRYNRDNDFAALKEMEIMERRLDFVSTMRDSLMTTNQETMEEEYYFDMEFLVDRYLQLSPDDIAANAAAKKRAEKQDAEAPEPEDPMGMGM